jgi:hypothetical protein
MDPGTENMGFLLWKAEVDKQLWDLTINEIISDLRVLEDKSKTTDKAFQDMGGSLDMIGKIGKKTSLILSGMSAGILSTAPQLKSFWAEVQVPIRELGTYLGEQLEPLFPVIVEGVTAFKDALIALDKKYDILETIVDIGTKGIEWAINLDQKDQENLTLLLGALALKSPTLTVLVTLKYGIEEVIESGKELADLKPEELDTAKEYIESEEFKEQGIISRIVKRSLVETARVLSPYAKLITGKDVTREEIGGAIEAARELPGVIPREAATSIIKYGDINITAADEGTVAELKTIVT